MFARFLLVLWQAVRELVRVRPSFEPVCDRMYNVAFSVAILAQAVFNGSVVPSRQQSVVVQLNVIRPRRSQRRRSQKFTFPGEVQWLRHPADPLLAWGPVWTPGSVP